MYLPYSEVKDLQFANPEKTAIYCQVFFKHVKYWLPFTATIKDISEHGREIYKKAMNGDFGDVKDYAAATVDEINIAVSDTDYSVAVQNLLDSTAKQNGYDSILSAVSYSTFENAFKEETLKLAIWRSEVWTACFELIKLNNESEKKLSIQEFIDSMPKFTKG